MGNLYSKFKIFHYKDKIDSLPLHKNEILAPIHIRIKPTNVCAHNCWYCAYKVDTLQLGKDMNKKDYIPKEKMLEIVDDIVDMNVKAVTFSGGGDPFYYPYLLETVKKLSDSTVKFAALTNGSRLSGELAEIFADKAMWLRISIDGWDDASYASYRGVPDGVFTKVMNNLSNFKKFGDKCLLGISLVVDKKNSPHIYSFIGRLKDIGVDSVKISPCIVSNDAAENNNYHQLLFDDVKEQVLNAVRDFNDSVFEIFDSYHALEFEFKKNYSWCPYLQILPVIGADQNIYSCQDKAYNLDEGLIGSIENQRFKDFWFSEKRKFFKINPSRVCNHRCVSHEKNKLIYEYLEVDGEHIGFV
jgi:MoaA/NifB/PqqE/SkfB family radical SAM enzyme